MNEQVFERLFRAAAEQDYVGNAKVAAAVVRRGEVVSLETNSVKTHPFQKKYSSNEDAIYLHAETHAILKAIKSVGLDELEGCDVYVARVKRSSPRARDFVPAMAKPCSGCQRAIAAHGIKNVYYTTEEGYDYL